MSTSRHTELGEQLKRRRVDLDPKYRSRGVFAAETGLNERLVADLENARREGYRDTTLAAVEVAYRLEPGTVSRFLEGRDADLVVLPESDETSQSGSGEAEGFPEITWEVEKEGYRFYTLTRRVPGHRAPQTTGHSMPADWPLGKVKKELEQLADFALFLRQRSQK